MLRGASSFNGDRKRLRSSSRINYPATNRYADRGFRCVLEVAPSTASVSPSPSLPVSSSSVATATKATPFTNTLGMKFVPKSPGSQVLFSIWETRRSDYEAFTRVKKVNAYWKNPTKDGVAISGGDLHPVVGVAWEDAKAFCDWLNEKEVAEGRLPPGIRYRLPTDDEWSSAVRLGKEQGATPEERHENAMRQQGSGTTSKLPSGKTINIADETFHALFPLAGDQNRWLAGYTDGYATTAPVGSFPPNEAGIHDLIGNAWEWCEDSYTPADPIRRVMRGGCWDSPNAMVLAAQRGRWDQSTRSPMFGFRVVLAPSGGGQAASTPPSPAAEPWVNLLTQPERLALQKPVTLTSEGLTFADSGSAYAKDSGPDGGIRIRATFSANRPNLRARQTGSGNYSLALHDDKTLSLSSYEVPQQRSTPLRDFTLSAPIRQGQDYILELRASGSTLTVVFNGTTLGSVSDGTHAKGDFNVVANRGLVIKGYELLLPQPAVSPSPSAAAPDAWLDVLRDPERLILSKTIERTADGLRFTDSGSAFVKDSGPDGGIRLRTSLGGLWTSLRARQADHGYYALAVHEQKTVRFTRFDSQVGRSTTLRDFNLSAPLQPGQEYSLELRADGPTFTAVLNGVTLGSVTDGAYTSGAFCVGAPAGGGPPAVIRSLELLALKPTTSPSPGTQGSKAPGAATKDAPFVNTLGMKFVPVPGTPVLFSIWPTRVQDYAEFAKAQEAAGKKVDGVWKNQEKDGVPVGHEADHPVVGLSWDDAQDFCQWLTMRDQSLGRLPQGMHYRLPKDEEWSWAVGLPEEMGETPDGKIAKNPVDFPWGKDWPPKGKVGNYADESFHATFPVKRNEKENRDENLWLEGYTDGYATTSPVGAFPANAYGLHDMGGNVWQWCEDWSNKSQTSRVLRGAPWSHHDRSNLQSSIRNRSTPTHRGRYVGFRVVLELAPSTTAVSPSPSPQGSASPSTATKDAPFVNSLGMKFVPVPITGGPTDGKGVLFSIWETRVQDYEAFVKEAKREWPNPDFKQEATHPAVMVNWDDAVAFCSWLTDKEQKAGKLPQDQIYRLPSDHEWSCAVGLGARGYLPIRESSNQGGQTFLWGAAWPPPVGSGNFKGQEAVTSSVRIPGWRDDFVKTSPVGFYPATAQGLHDLAGNAWEWVADPAHDSASTRFARGGSMAGGEPEWIRLEKRNRMFKERRGDDVGFRIVLVPVAN